MPCSRIYFFDKKQDDSLLVLLSNGGAETVVTGAADFFAGKRGYFFLQPLPPLPYLLQVKPPE